ncbi:MAG: hypothetical protein GY737_29780, partial [Desulfobacteraceae bacterium]|nr:hypothetical protein [Desulfobacteraceae bacterium]
QFYTAAYNWMVSLYRYDRLMCGNGKTLWQIKSHGIACAEGFINYRKWRHTIWKKLPGDSWKMGHCTTTSLIGPDEGKLEGMTREDWNDMRGNKRNVFGDSLPRECKPFNVQRNERLEEYYANNPRGQHEFADDQPFEDDDDDDVDDGEADETVNDAIPPIVEKPKSKPTTKTPTNGNNKPKEQARKNTKGKNRQSGRKSTDKQSAGEGGNRKESEGQEEEAGGGASNTGPPSGPPGPPDPNER